MACVSLEDDIEGYVNIRRANFRWRPLSLWNRNLQLHLRRKLSTFDIQNLREGNNPFLVADFLNAHINLSAKAWVQFFDSPKIAFSELSAQSWWRAAENSRCRNVHAACAVVKHNSMYVAVTAICWEGATLATYPPEDGVTDHCGHERIRAACKEIRALWCKLNVRECRCDDCVLFYETARFVSRAKCESRAGREKSPFGPKSRKIKESTIKIGIAAPLTTKKTLFTTTSHSPADTFVKFEPKQMVKNPQRTAKGRILTGFLDLNVWGTVGGSTGTSTPVLDNAPDISTECVHRKAKEQQDPGSLWKETPYSAQCIPGRRATGRNSDISSIENDFAQAEQRDEEERVSRSESPSMRSNESAANANRRGLTAQTHKTPSPTSPQTQTRVLAAVPYRDETTLDEFLQQAASTWDQDVTRHSASPLTSKDAEARESVGSLTTKQLGTANASSTSASQKQGKMHDGEGAMQHSPQLPVRDRIAQPVHEQQAGNRGTVLNRTSISSAQVAPEQDATIPPKTKTGPPSHEAAAKKRGSVPVDAGATHRGVIKKTVASPNGAALHLPSSPRVTPAGVASPKMLAMVGSGDSAVSSPLATPKERASFRDSALRSSGDEKEKYAGPGKQQQQEQDLQGQQPQYQSQEQSPSRSTSFLLAAAELQNVGKSFHTLPNSFQEGSTFVVRDVFAPSIIRASFAADASESAERYAENVEGTPDQCHKIAARNRMDGEIADIRRGIRVEVEHEAADDEKDAGMGASGDADRKSTHFETAAMPVDQRTAQDTISVDLFDTPPHVAPNAPPSCPGSDSTSLLPRVIRLHDATRSVDTSGPKAPEDNTPHGAPVYRSSASSTDIVSPLAAHAGTTSYANVRRLIDSPSHASDAKRYNMHGDASTDMQLPSPNVLDNAPAVRGSSKHIESPLIRLIDSPPHASHAKRHDRRDDASTDMQLPSNVLDNAPAVPVSSRNIESPLISSSSVSSPPRIPQGASDKQNSGVTRPATRLHTDVDSSIIEGVRAPLGERTSVSNADSFPIKRPEVGHVRVDQISQERDDAVEPAGAHSTAEGNDNEEEDATNVEDAPEAVGKYDASSEEESGPIALDQLSDSGGSVESDVSSGTEERVIFDFPGAHYLHHTPLSLHFPSFTPNGTTNGSFAQLAKAPLPVSPSSGSSKSNLVAITFLPATNPATKPSHIDRLTSFLQLTPHANIDPLLCVFMPHSHLTIAITPYRRSPTLLRTILRAPHITSQAWVADVFHQVIASVAYLHRQKLHICGALHVGNIRIDHKTRVVLCEAGWGNNDGMTLGGPAEVAAPEVIQKTGHVMKSDTWTLGVLFYLLLTGMLPFGHLRGPERICEVLAEEDTWSIPEKDMDVVTTVSARKFATSMLNVRANNRPSVMLCTQHPWTKSLSAHQQQNTLQGNPSSTSSAGGALDHKVIDRLRQYQAELDARKRAVEAVAAEMGGTAERLDWLHRVCLADLSTALAQRQFSPEACARVRAWTHSAKFRVDGTSGSSEFATWCVFLFEGNRSMQEIATRT